MVPILLVKNVLLTFQIEQNGTFLDNFKNDYWILHQKLVLDKIFTIFHKTTHTVKPLYFEAHLIRIPVYFEFIGYF